MELLNLPVKKNINILALGAESAGVFAIYRNGSIFVSENFGDLLDENNFLKYKKAVLGYFPPKADQPRRIERKEKVKLDIVLSDLHPLYKTTIFAEEIAGKYNIPHIKIQHHIAHVFSSFGDCILLPTTHYPLPTSFFGLAMDGTGYGLDENIWGGEVFRLQITNHKKQITNKLQITNPKIQIERIGSLEEQIMIGGDLAVREPARMLIAILAKITNYKKQITNKTQNDFIYKFVKKFYTRNEFELLYNQLEQGFNCRRTTSTGRILDAASVLLGFAGNERKYKHEAVKKMEDNSGEPYGDIESRIKNQESRKILDTTYLFEYLIKNIHKDKKRLAATAQLYIAKSLYKIIEPFANCHKPLDVFAAGGLTNNMVISSYLEKQGVYLAKKIPRGDEGIAVGQIVYFLL